MSDLLACKKGLAAFRKAHSQDQGLPDSDRDVRLGDDDSCQMGKLDRWLFPIFSTLRLVSGAKVSGWTKVSWLCDRSSSVSDVKAMNSPPLKVLIKLCSRCSTFSSVSPSKVLLLSMVTLLEFKYSSLKCFLPMNVSPERSFKLFESR